LAEIQETQCLAGQVSISSNRKKLGIVANEWSHSN
jgi:hypothetical protein